MIILLFSFRAESLPPCNKARENALFLIPVYIRPHGWRRALCGVNICAVISMPTKTCGLGKEPFPKGRFAIIIEGRMLGVKNNRCLQQVMRNRGQEGINYSLRL